MIIIMGVFIILLLLDIISVFALKNGIQVVRHCPNRLSNGDQNPISISVKNLYSYRVNIKIVEEVPFQFQKRDLIFDSSLKSGEEKMYHYNVRPVKRGIYSFGAVNVFVGSQFGLITKRYVFNQNKQITVYPSFIELRKYELLAASNRLKDYGIKKIRRIGNATEFDHIEQYVLGDDPRTINYKATAHANKLMVNKFEDEKSQQVYCIIDKGRTMKMPFNGMTLLDYAINSTLMVSSTALNRGDKVGIITFSRNIDNIVSAEKNRKQRNKILEALYTQKTDFKESDYEILYITIRRKITQRSLIVFYTNFDTVSGMKRQLKYLRLLAKDHLVLVAFFINSEFNSILESQPTDIENMFRKGIAESLSNDKLLIVRELKRNGIHTILSKPENLTIDSINKYLELKARGLI